MSYNGIEVNHIVAVDLNGCIGKHGKIPWHIPADLKRFRELTTGGVVVMGRKTFDSLGRKSLPNRMNIVIGSTMVVDDYYGNNKELIYCESINEALLTARYYVKQKQKSAIWIIGGAEIYTQTLQYVDNVEATVVSTKIISGDAHYPPIDYYKENVKVSRAYTDKSGLSYCYMSYRV